MKIKLCTCEPTELKAQELIASCPNCGGVKKASGLCSAHQEPLAGCELCYPLYYINTPPTDDGLVKGWDLAKIIMQLIPKYYDKKDTHGQMGFAECCGICGEGSTSFCPCSQIVHLLDESLQKQAALSFEAGRNAGIHESAKQEIYCDDCGCTHVPGSPDCRPESPNMTYEGMAKLDQSEWFDEALKTKGNL